jgi:peptidoglycan/LPS O-acetylase OafA/YrhL
VLTQTMTAAPGRAVSGPAASGRRSRPHAAELDVVRPVASLLVIVTHAMQMFASTGSIFYGAIVLESEASRHVFFFVAALVLTYQAYRQPRWSPWHLWRRRGLIIVVPYAIWVLIYWAVGLAGLRGDTIPGPSASMLLNLKSAGMQLITGPGHLYFVFVLMQFYLVAGAITGAHLPAVRAWVWRHRWPVLAAAAALILAVQAWYVLTVRSGQSATRTSDPFSPEAIALYLGMLALLWLAGAWWANRSHSGWPSRLVRTTSDNSYGVYLSHIMFLDILATLGLGRLDSDVPWIVTVSIAVPVAGPDLALGASSLFPQEAHRSAESSQPTSGCEPGAGSALTGRLTR